MESDSAVAAAAFQKVKMETLTWEGRRLYRGDGTGSYTFKTTTTALRVENVCVTTAATLGPSSSPKGDDVSLRGGRRDPHPSVTDVSTVHHGQKSSASSGGSRPAGSLLLLRPPQPIGTARSRSAAGFVTSRL